jgi:hypothetical protein
MCGIRLIWRLKALTLGVYPIVLLADARKARDAAKKLLARDVGR